LNSLPEGENFCLHDAAARALGNIVPCADGRCVAITD